MGIVIHYIFVFTFEAILVFLLSCVWIGFWVVLFFKISVFGYYETREKLMEKSREAGQICDKECLGMKCNLPRYHAGNHYAKNRLAGKKVEILWQNEWLGNRK